MKTQEAVRSDTLWKSDKKKEKGVWAPRGSNLWGGKYMGETNGE